MERVVGKNVLESLTTGMYSDSKIIYREYIQNATDSIDNAIKLGLITTEKAKIEILIDEKKREIKIKDNGTGIPYKKVLNTLGDIGKSEKDFKEQRGFRGIGRLGGLGYCEELIFITSYKGENIKTINTWNCVKLKELLQPHVAQEMNVIDVINDITVIKEEKEDVEKHYFEVILKGIDKQQLELLNLELIKIYLSQVAPAPYNYQQYSELKHINENLRSLGKLPQEYDIVLNGNMIYKPYKRAVAAGDKQKKQKDFIKELKFFDGYKSNGDLLFLGWYGMTELSGSIKEKEVAGFRVRKHNILIGDHYTLDSFFGNSPTYQHFNRWFVGEIFVFDEHLIPNARRDDFEKNKAYYDFKKELEKITIPLSRLPHPYSTARNEQKKLYQAEDEIQNIVKELEQGFTQTRKNQLIEKLDEHKDKLKKITGKSTDSDKSKNEDIIKKKDILIKKIEDVQTVIENSRNFKTNRIPTSFTKETRRVIQLIFEVIDKNLPEGQAQEMEERIIEELSKTRK